MDLERLEAQSLIEKGTFSGGQIKSNLNRAQHDLRTAKTNLEIPPRFNRMRIKRHDFIYDPERPIPKTEAVKSLESAEQFVQEIIQRIEKMKPQKRLIE